MPRRADPTTSPPPRTCSRRVPHRGDAPPRPSRGCRCEAARLHGSCSRRCPNRRVGLALLASSARAGQGFVYVVGGTADAARDARDVRARGATGGAGSAVERLGQRPRRRDLGAVTTRASISACRDPRGVGRRAAGLKLRARARGGGARLRARRGRFDALRRRRRRGTAHVRASAATALMPARARARGVRGSSAVRRAAAAAATPSRRGRASGRRHKPSPTELLPLIVARGARRPVPSRARARARPPPPDHHTPRAPCRSSARAAPRCRRTLRSPWARRRGDARPAPPPPAPRRAGAKKGPAAAGRRWRRPTVGARHDGVRRTLDGRRARGLAALSKGALGDALDARMSGRRCEWCARDRRAAPARPPSPRASRARPSSSCGVWDGRTARPSPPSLWSPADAPLRRAARAPAPTRPRPRRAASRRRPRRCPRPTSAGERDGGAFASPSLGAGARARAGDVADLARLRRPRMCRASVRYRSPRTTLG